MGFLALALARGGAGSSGGGSMAGKGLFVRSTGHAGSPSTLVSDCQAMGIRWVMLPVIWQYEDKASKRYDGQIKAYADALKAAGIRVWVWGWGVPDKWQDFADTMKEAQDKIRAVGIVANLEKPWFNRPQEAHLLAQALSGRTWGLSSYGGGPKNIPSFPWQQLNSATYGMPQIYDTQHTLGPDYPARSVSTWRDAGYTRIAPTLGASSAHSKAQMIDIADRTVAVGGIGALSWWDYYHLKQSASRRSAVAEIQIGAQA